MVSAILPSCHAATSLAVSSPIAYTCIRHSLRRVRTPPPVLADSLRRSAGHPSITRSSAFSLTFTHIQYTQQGGSVQWSDMASMVHHHHHSHSPSAASHPLGHEQHAHSTAATGHHAITSYSYSPSDFDLLKALTSGSAGKTSAKRALKSQQSQSLRRPQLDPLILETAASSGPHITRNHFLHEFYPHPEDPSSAFSWHALVQGDVNPRDNDTTARRPGAYASCDLGPEDDIHAASSHLQGALEQGDYPTASTSTLPTKPFTSSTEDANSNEADDASPHAHPMYRSRQAPRNVRLKREGIEQHELDRRQEEQADTTTHANGDIHNDSNGAIHSNLKDVDPSEKLHHSLSTPDSQDSIFHPDPIHLPQLLKISQPSFFNPFPSSISQTPPPSINTIPPASRPPLQVVCYARTRVPTPHGEVFLHIYKNNWDDKEHLAFVFDRDQLEDTSSRSGANIHESGNVIREQAYGALRSKTLDSVWRRGETDVERIVRGAYVGRLSPTSAQVSRPTPASSSSTRTTNESNMPTSIDETNNTDDAVLVRIHSECFTGETIGSQRCDCGEQLDEAFRLIGTSQSGLGIIIYLKQEGRGIGLLEKIKAYNLQDLGHDTVTANLLLGHSADQRDYALAGEMLRDLGVGAGQQQQQGVQAQFQTRLDESGKARVGEKSRNIRLLTNNPDKIDSIEKEGIKVEERVPMVPRGWTVQMPHLAVRRKKSKKSSKKGSKTNKDGSEGRTKKTRRSKSNMADSITSIRSIAAESSPLASPALSASNAGGFKIKNKTIEALKPLSSSTTTTTPYDHDGIRSIEVSEAETEDNEIDDAIDSSEMPSVPGSADEGDSISDMNREDEEVYSDEEEEDEENDESDSDDSLEREEALEDYLISMNRTGVGMIGAGVTHSKELEKYLKTKVERMGHLLIVPNTPPSTPLPLQRHSRIRNNKQHLSKLKNEDPNVENDNGKTMSDSITSLPKTDEETNSYFDSELHSEDMFG